MIDPARRAGLALAALLALAPTALAQPQPEGCGGGSMPPSSLTARSTGSTYAAASTAGTFAIRTGQAADLVLSAAGFDDAGGPLLFNHNGGIASDGRRLLLCDRNNNRVLVWSSLPTGNVPPDLVLGQTSLTTNNPGKGRGQMNWPIAVATDGTRILVADAYNDRILIWTSWPAASGAPADLVLANDPAPGAAPKRRLRWPWGVYTDGNRVVVSATGSKQILIWSTFPAREDQPADIVLTDGGRLGTPRGVTSDGRSLIVGDHNAGGSFGGDGRGNWVWRSFPTADEAPADFFLKDPCDTMSGFMQGELTADGKLLLLGRGLYVWNAVPASASQQPDLKVFPPRVDLFGGDGSDVAVAGGRIYASVANGNKVVGWNALPTRGDQLPDVVLGSPDAFTNTLDESYFITNPVVASNGRSLFAASDFDRKLYVWKALPGESGARPDLVYSVPDNALRDIASWGDRMALAGERAVLLWNRPPVDGQPADVTFRDGIGSARFVKLTGVAMDDRRFYLADQGAGKLWVWDGVPTASSEPALTLDVALPDRIDSDGTWLSVTSRSDGESAVLLYRIADLGAGAPAAALTRTPSTRFNLPGGAYLGGGRLFVADTGFNRVLGWTRVEDAVAGRDPDLILGASSLDDLDPEIGRDKLFWPATAAFDGRYLWVGEFKFSGRLLRYGGEATSNSVATELFVPAAASAPGRGGSHWKTELTLFNPDTTSTRAVALAFLSAGGDNGAARQVTVAVSPRRAVVLDDVVGQALGAAGGGGLRLLADGGLRAMSWTYNAAAPERFGISVPALPASAALSRGAVFPLSNRAGFRVNAGFLNAGGTATQVTAELLDATTGELLERFTVDLAPFGWRQLDDLFRTRAPGATGLLTFTSGRPVFGYGIVLENGTGDGTYLPAAAD